MKDPVGVRRLLLPALVEAELIAEPTLIAFKNGGFVFDHGIRCHLARDVMERERAKARSLRPSIADNATHLRDAVNVAPKVWVMGAVARAAVASQFPDVRFLAQALDAPYTAGSKFFVSQYFRPRFDRASRITAIVERLVAFLE